jgi:hypothetical protein
MEKIIEKKDNIPYIPFSPFSEKTKRQIEF